ncbi:MAG: response regulator [Candidatus Hodarchaeales archaeon]|jgi:PAS domain S-box-containing protein
MLEFFFAILSFLISSYVSFFIGSFILAKNSKKILNQYFSIMSFLVAHWSLMIFFTNSTSDYETVLLLFQLNCLWPFIFPFFILTLIEFTKKKINQKIMFYSFIFIPAIIFSIKTLIVNGNEIELTRENGMWFIKSSMAFVEMLNFIWVFLIFIYALYLCFSYLQETTSLIIKNQTKLIITSIIIIFIGTFSINLLLIINIFVPISTIHFILITNIIIGWGIYKHELFTLDPVTAVDTIISSMSNLLFLLDPNGLIVLVNPIVLETLDYSEKELIDLPIQQILVLDENEIIDMKFIDFFEEYFVSGKEVLLIKKDKKKVPILLSVAGISDNKNQEIGYVCTGSNLEELKNVWKQIQQQEWLAAVGRLTAGIAHDLNNILSSITGYTKLLAEESMIQENHRERLTKITKQGFQASTLIHKLLDYSLQSPTKITSLEIVSYLKEFIDIYKPDLPGNIVISLKTNSNEFWVQADPTQLQQILFNLTSNAKDAILDNEGGSREITYRLSRKNPQNIQSLNSTHKEVNGWICLEVDDTGKGIPQEIHPHIFKPLFTTKKKSYRSGYGLGLSQTYGLVKLQRGEIDFESQEDVGSTFYIYLHEGPKKIEEKTIILEYPQGKGQTILIVDDNPDICEIFQEILSKNNYHVITAENGQVALEIFEKKPTIELIILDMIMDDISGNELFNIFKHKNNQIKIIVITGYFNRELKDELLNEGVDAWFQKPIEFNELCKTVNILLR